MGAIDFTVRCSDEQCKEQLATYKIAAAWSSGELTELKAFGFANDECLDRVMESALARVAKAHFGDGEELGEMCIFRLDSKRHDYELQRMTELEKRYRPCSTK